MKNRRFLVLLLTLSLRAAPVSGQPLAADSALANLQKSWEGGLGPSSWRQLEALEKQPRDTWPKALQITHALTLGQWLEQLGQLDESHEILSGAAQSALAVRQEAPEMSPLHLAHLSSLLEALSSLALRLNRVSEAAGWLQKLNDLKLLQQQDGRRADPEIAHLEQIRGNLANLSNQLGTTTDVSTQQRLTLHQSQERRAFTETLEKLRARFPEYDRLASLRATEVPQVQADLPPDVVVLQMFAAPDGVYLLALSGERRISHFTPVPQAKLLQTIQEYRTAMEDGKETAAADQLSQWLVVPLLDSLKGKRVLWLPSGELSQLPLDCLPVQGHTFGDEIVLSQVYSTDLTPGKRHGDQVVAMGAAAGVDLPGTEAELNKLAALFPHHVTLEGQQASLARLNESAATCDILHLASHAGGDPRHPETDYLQLADQKIHIGDILNLNLRPGWLVFLSACNSGRASGTQVRDVNSLANAFRAAGAGTVVYTLWPIDDEASVAFVEHFYRELAQGRSSAQALALSKAHMRQTQFRQPQYWGAFQMIGKDW